MPQQCKPGDVHIRDSYARLNSAGVVRCNGGFASTARRRAWSGVFPPDAYFAPNSEAGQVTTDGTTIRTAASSSVIRQYGNAPQ